MPSGIYKRTEETNLINSESHMGHKWTEESKRKLSKSKGGENAWNWKGGISGTKEYQRSRARNLRQAVIGALGGKCVRCGFEDSRALQIDHINGGGHKEIKEGNYTGTYHRNVITSFLKEENKYQLLCANCNWIKRSENNEIRNY